VSPARPSPGAERKAAARRLVEGFDLDGVEAWAASEPRALRVLQPLLYDRHEIVRWRAVEALGRAAAARARAGLEPVRELLRRVLWLMNDESGGIAWHGPEVLGAALANVPRLCDEFGAIVASFLEEEPFRVGTRWALWRLAPARPEIVVSAVGPLAVSLGDPEPAVRGHAALALRAARAGDLSALAHDRAPFDVFDYRTGALRSTTVRAAASGAP
jgi:HEAT repeat protein